MNSPLSQPLAFGAASCINALVGRTIRCIFVISASLLEWLIWRLALLIGTFGVGAAGTGECTINSAASLSARRTMSEYQQSFNMLSTEEYWRVDGPFTLQSTRLCCEVTRRLVFHRTYCEPEVRASIERSASVALPPCHAICKKRRPNVAPVVGGSATHAGGNRQYDASIVRIVVRSLVLQLRGSKIRCI